MSNGTGEPWPQHVCDKLKAARLRAKLTQADAADAADVVQVTWHHVESGKYGCRRSTLERMAAAVGMRVVVELRRG